MGITSIFAINKSNKTLNKKQKENFKTLAKIQATQGGFDVMTWESIFSAINKSKEADKNNFKTYESQVEAIYRMYYNESDYGGELMRGLIDTRTSMICGEGLNVDVMNSQEYLDKEKENKLNEMIDNEENIDIQREANKKFIEKFIKFNKLDTVNIFKLGLISEMEGKILIILNPDKKNQNIKIKIFSYKQNKYSVEKDIETGEIVKIKYGQDKIIDPKRVVFIQTAGTDDDFNKTPPKIANVLTQIENYSRARYDLRKNNHVYAKTMLTGETIDNSAANSIKNDMVSKKFIPGKDGYVGPVKWSYISQSNSASDNISAERLMDIRDIATTSGNPVFFLNYPDLMSNRATAETMMESVNQATKKERLIIADGLKELIIKAMEMATDNNFENAVYDPESFEVSLPLMTLDNIKALVETWAVLWEKDLISKQTVQNLIPGINPMDENKLIQAEKKENMNNNPVVKNAMSDILGDHEDVPEDQIDQDNADAGRQKIQSGSTKWTMTKKKKQLQ